MGFSLPFGKERKTRKLIENYLKNEAGEREAFNEQTKRLDAQLHDRQIDQQTHERYRAILEKHYHQKQKEECARAVYYLTHNNF